MSKKILAEIACEHLPYEIDMLRSTYRRLSSLGIIDPDFETNEQKVYRFALIESFCIHARALFDFFSDKKKHSTDFIASDFTKGYTTPFAPNDASMKALRTKLNKQLFHLTTNRTTVIVEKFDVSIDGKLLLSKLEPAIEQFTKCLMPAFQNFRCSTAPEQWFVGLLFTGATGAFHP